MAARFIPGVVKGDWEGYKAALFVSGRASSTSFSTTRKGVRYVYLILLFPQPFPFFFRIENGKGLMAWVMRRFLGEKVVKPSDAPELDPLILASSNEVGQLGDYLANTSVQN